MEQKTKVHAQEGRQDLLIIRDFDLPVALVFTAFTEPGIVAQWMDTTVLKLESRKHGSYQFQKADAQGNVYFRANGTIHDIVPDSRITRTFEIENAPMGVQLELLTFEAVTDTTSRLHMHVVYESEAHREKVLQMPFRQGINMAHNRLEEIMQKQ